MYFINSYCRINASRVSLNGKIIFDSKQQQFATDDFLNALYKHLNIDYRKFYKMDLLTKLGFLASELLLKGIDREQPKQDMGIIFFNRSSSLEADKSFQATIQRPSDFFPSPAEFVYTLPNIVIGEIAIRNKIYGETAFYVLKNFYSDTINTTIEDTIFAAGLKCVLAGWIEVNVSENKQDCFMALCSSKQGDKNNSCLPAGFEHVYAGEQFSLKNDLNDLYNY